jgi:hypothetical protein
MYLVRLIDEKSGRLLLARVQDYPERRRNLHGVGIPVRIECVDLSLSIPSADSLHSWPHRENQHHEQTSVAA